MISKLKEFMGFKSRPDGVRNNGNCSVQWLLWMFGRRAWNIITTAYQHIRSVNCGLGNNGN